MQRAPEQPFLVTLQLHPQVWCQHSARLAVARRPVRPAVPAGPLPAAALRLLH